eukprot:TRINITY_DN13441_c0_g1_i1.p1 TRINITY_DN13441_c0_g1~~TRINITY_DN13441_c0_g1_i1.p1  ORF type:complete len:702 (+),score=124.53 TRINITY_DN13441_c0_g1_i1:3-2108(+)
MDDFDLDGDLDMDGMDANMSVTDLLNVELVKTKDEGLGTGLKKKMKNRSNTKTAKALWGQVDSAEDEILPSKCDHEVAADSLPGYVHVRECEIQCCECSSIQTAKLDTTRTVCVACNQSLQILKPEQSTDDDTTPLATRPAPCEPCPDTGREMQFSDWCERLSRFYAKYDPQKVMGRQIGQIIRSWGGKEHELLQIMISKHGPEPTTEEGTQLLTVILGGAKAPEDVGGDIPLSLIPEEPLSGKVILKAPQKGVSIGCDVRRLSVDPPSLVIVNIHQDSQAGSSDLMCGHIIHKCDGKIITSLDSLREVISEAEGDITFVVSVAVSMIKCPSPTCPSVSGNAAPSIEALSYCDCCCLLCDATFTLSKQPLIAPSNCPQTSKPMTHEDWQLRLSEYITSHNIEKQVLSCDKHDTAACAANLEELLKAWLGTEDVLLEKLVRKYGAEKSNTSAHVEQHKLTVNKSDILKFNISESSSHGVLLTAPDEASPQPDCPLVSGNVIHKVCGEPTPSKESLLQLLDNIDPTDQFTITVSLCADNLSCYSCGEQRVIPESSKTFLCPACGIVMSAAKQSVDCSNCPVTGDAMSFQEWRVRLARFYAKYAPEKVPGRGLDQILRSWSGREAELLSKMIQRYGPEPDAAQGDELLQQVLSSAAPPPLDDDDIEVQEPQPKTSSRSKSKSFFKSIIDKTREKIPNPPSKRKE